MSVTKYYVFSANFNFSGDTVMPPIPPTFNLVGGGSFERKDQAQECFDKSSPKYGDQLMLFQVLENGKSELIDFRPKPNG